MKYNHQYIQIGMIKETRNGWKLNLKTERHNLKEVFPTVDDAIKQIEKFVKELHKNQEVPVSVKYSRLQGGVTFLCYDEHGAKPKEYSAFDYYGFNSSFSKGWERRTYMTPRFITYNAVARTSASERVEFRRLKNFFDVFTLIAWILLIAFSLKLAFDPSPAAKSSAAISGLEYNNPLVWGMMLGGLLSLVGYLIADNVPRIIFWRTSRSFSEYSKKKLKYYGEGKNWRPYYRSRVFGNIWGMALLAITFIILVLSVWFMGTSVYTQFDAHLKGTVIIMILLVATLLFIVAQACLIVYASMKMRSKRKTVLEQFIRNDMKPYFRSWTMFEGIKNEELEFNSSIFVYPPSPEQIVKSYEMVKKNLSLSKKEKLEIRRNLKIDWKNGLIKIRNASRSNEAEKETLISKIKTQKEKLSKEGRKIVKQNKKASKVKEVETITKVVALEKNKKKQKSKTQKDLNKKAKELKKAEAKRLKDIRDAKKAEAKKAKAKKKN